MNQAFDFFRRLQLDTGLGHRADPVQQFEEADQRAGILVRLVLCVALTLGVLALSAQLLA